MKETFSKRKGAFKYKTFAEFIDSFPPKYIEIMAFFPIFLFVLLPPVQLVHDFISPLSHGVSYAVKVFEVFLCAATVGVLAMALYIIKKLREKNRPAFKILLKNNLPMVFFGIAAVLMLISTLINGFTKKALRGDPYRRESIFTFLAYLLVYFPCAALVSGKKLRAALFYTFIAASLPIAVFAVIDHAYVKIDAFKLCTGLSAVFHQFNHYGYYLIVVILASAVLFVKEKNAALRILCLVSFVINNITLIFNNTFGCYLACFVALVFCIIIISVVDKRLNWLSVGVLGLFIVITLVMSFWTNTVFTNITTFFRDVENVAENAENAASAGTGRWTLWTHTAEYIKERPLFGFGVEGINERLSSDTHGVNDRPHNEFLEYAAFFGIPAAAAYVCGVVSVFLGGLKNRKKLDRFALAGFAAAFAYLVSSVFGNTMYYTAPFLFIMLGLARSKTVDS